MTEENYQYRTSQSILRNQYIPQPLVRGIFCR